MMVDDRGYWVGFSLVHGIGPVRIQRLLDHFGVVEQAWNATRIELKEAGIPRNVVENLIQIRSSRDVEQELERLQNLGIEILTLNDQEYPSWLREINSPPILLYIRGELGHEPRVAIVGTRRPTSYGVEAAKELATALTSAGVCIVSGLARGIDGVAHRAALDAGGRTLAILGSGLDQIYPPEHRKLAETISTSGAVITEYALGTRPEAGNFPPRNRIISGLSQSVMIVEAGESSGALITADFAADQGRDVYAVPGTVFSRASRGTNRLIQQGAIPVLSAEDVLESLNLEAVSRTPSPKSLPTDPSERSIYGILSADPIHIDDLGVKCGLPASELIATLSMLELRGFVKRVGGMHYIRLREQGPLYKVE